MYSENPWIIISYPLGLFIINYFEIPIGISGCAQRKLDDDDDVHENTHIPFFRRALSQSWAWQQGTGLSSWQVRELCVFVCVSNSMK